MGGDEKKVKGELPRTDGSYPRLYRMLMVRIFLTLMF